MDSCPQCKQPLPIGVVICPNCGVLLPPILTRQRIETGTTIDRGFGKLVIDRRLGEGGMGVVWRAWVFFPPGTPREAAPELIAVKVLRPQAHVREELRHFFMTEAEALRRVLHPNIVRFVDLFEWNSSLALAMEYVDGDTLEDVIARHLARAKLAGPAALPGIPFRRAWNYWEQLLGALAATHAVGVVHRDVKPSNVLVRRDGIVKLTDYGIARLAAGSPTPTIEKDLAPGTGAYMSPEQVTGDRVDARSDLYSAAIVLYEMLSGRPPFSSRDLSEFAIRQRQVTTQSPPLRRFLPQAPPMLDALFSRALAKDPAARFASAVEMGNAFRLGLGLPDSPEWRAQVDFAQVAAPFAIARVSAPAPAPGPGPAPPTREAVRARPVTVPLRASAPPPEIQLRRDLPPQTTPVPTSPADPLGTTLPRVGDRASVPIVPLPVVSLGPPSPSTPESAAETSPQFAPKRGLEQAQKKMATLRDFLVERYRAQG